MKMLVIYDNTGFILDKIQGSSLYEPVGIPFLWVEIPEGKDLKSINVSVNPNIPIFEDKPKSEMQILKEENEKLTSKVASQESVISEILESILPEIFGMLG